MTSRELWVRLRPLMPTALELPPEDRAGYLNDVCRADAELREEAERVLEACVQANHSLGFLDSPAIELAAPLLTLEAEALVSSDELIPGVEVGPFVLERHLGSGGMGVVYLARDPRLDRRVALKLLPAWLPLDDEASRRLMDEAKAASRLDHPNIQTVYEIGRAPDHRPFIAMAFYDGETLKDRITEGPRDIESTLGLGRQIADGLAAAHAHGIVHRDVKPGNVIVTHEGLVKILDFGAALIGGGGLGQGTHAIGTVAYMSPEQTLGEEVDARTDVWALGVVFYEMLTGRRPFTGDDVASVMRAVRNEEPPSLEGLRPAAPDVLVRVVERCLEKDADARFADAAAVAADLEGAGDGAIAGGPRPAERRSHSWRLTTAAALMGGALLGAAVLWPKSVAAPEAETNAPAGLPVTAIHRLAVLPLALTAERSEDEYLSEALTDELIASLDQVEGLDVATRGQIVPYEGLSLGVDRISRILDVETVLVGSVWAAGEQIHLSVRLTSTSGREPLWSNDYVASFSDLLSIEHQVVVEVAEALELRPPEVPGRLATPSGPAAGQVLRAYWKGQHFLHMLATPGASRRARDWFDEALRMDSAYAPAWAGLSGALHQLVMQGVFEPLEAEPIAMRAAEWALDLDSTLADAHTHLAAIQSWFGWNEAEADEHFLRAIELDPRSARAHRFFAVHLRNHGRFGEALRYVREGVALDPQSRAAICRKGSSCTSWDRLRRPSPRTNSS
jgi:TolB-like protein